MVHYSTRELDTKIHAFMKKKMHQFPELEDETYFVERQEDEAQTLHHRGQRHNKQLFPVIRLSSQY